MKRVNVLCLVLAMVAGSAFATLPTPMVHWALDGTGPGANQTPDALGVHPADLSPGSGQPAFATGVIGNAVEFDVNGERVTAQDPTGGLSIGTGDGTIALWIRHDGPGLGGLSEAVYIEKLNTASTPGYTLYSRDYDEGSSNGILYLYNPAPGHGNLMWNAATAGFTVNDGAWHHIALTKKANGVNDEMTIYFDGVSLGTNLIGLNTAMDVAGSAVWMGRRNPGIWGNDITFNGALDDVYLFHSALTQTQIQELMVPEPATLGLLAVGGLLLRKRKK